MAEIRINTTGGLKLYDADNSHYAQIIAGTITSNVDAITLGHDTVTIADNLSLGRFFGISSAKWSFLIFKLIGFSI